MRGTKAGEGGRSAARRSLGFRAKSIVLITLFEKQHMIFFVKIGHDGERLRKLGS